MTLRLTQQRAMSSGFSLCCRAISDGLFRPARTSRTTWALNCGVKDRRLRLGVEGRSWEASIDYRTGPIPGAHFSCPPIGLETYLKKLRS